MSGWLTRSPLIFKMSRVAPLHMDFSCVPCATYYAGHASECFDKINLFVVVLVMSSLAYRRGNHYFLTYLLLSLHIEVIIFILHDLQVWLAIFVIYHVSAGALARQDFACLRILAPKRMELIWVRASIVFILEVAVNYHQIAIPR